MADTLSRLRRQFSPVRPWYAKVSAETMKRDAVAGFTNAAIVLPQGVAFAIIAGLPPEYGLYTAMIPPIIAAIFGASMVMVSGPTTAISAVLFATLSEHAAPGTPAYVNMALTLTIIVGLMQLAAGLARLGALISFISHSVIIGFTAAAAVLIGASQLAPALGLTVERGGGVIERLLRVAHGIEGTNPVALALALATIGTILICLRIDKRLPSYLVALVVGSAFGYALDAPAAGIAMFDPLPSILPGFSAPQTDFQTLANLVPGAATIAFVALLEAISIGRAFAIRRNEPYDSNHEIVGQGLSNVIGGFFKCYAGSGSFTRSALNAESGARTPLSAIFAAGFLLLMLILLAPFVRLIPVPVMAGIILYVAWRLINFAEVAHVRESSRSETFILAATFVAGIAVELEFAIVVGVISSLFVFLRKSAAPMVSMLAPVIHKNSRSFRDVTRYDIPQCPQIAVYRIEGPLYFASIEYVEGRFRDYETVYGVKDIVVLHLRGVGTIDLAGADFLIKEIRTIRSRGGQMHLIATRPEVVRVLKNTHVVEALGEDHLHLGKADAVAEAVAEAQTDMCGTCRIRAFQECVSKPAPDGLDGYVSQIELRPTRGTTG